MASTVDICNLALSHLGNKAQVVSISPVDGSVEADYCARFFTIARDEVLEMNDWTFARTRVELAQLSTNPSNVWQYAYLRPADCITPRRMMPTGDATLHEDDSVDFDQEGDVLLTDLANAILIYTRPIEDPTRFSPGFVTALSYKLAAYLAGPILRGESGTNAAASLHGIAAKKAKEATSFDANRSWRSDEFVPSMVAARGGSVPGTATGSNPVIYPESGYAIS
jgi:hypothetical protein